MLVSTAQPASVHLSHRQTPVTVHLAQAMADSVVVLRMPAVLIVVSGTAKVTMGEKTLLLTENQSTYIPLGVAHRLENPGRIPLEMIEVQSGSYLGEDDIVRFEDNYGRS